MNYHTNWLLSIFTLLLSPLQNHLHTGIFVLVKFAIGNSFHLSPVSPLNPPFSVIIIWGFLCWQVYPQRGKNPFKESSGTYSSLSPSQYSIITNTDRSSISFLCYSDYVIPQYYSKSSSPAFIASPNKPNFVIFILPVHFLFPLMNLLNHLILVGLVVTIIYLSEIFRVAIPSARTPALQIFPYAAV